MVNHKESTVTDESRPNQTAGEPVNIFLALSLLFRWKKLIIINFLIITGTVVIISLFLPKWYKATASVLPSQDDDMLSNLGGGSLLMKSLGALPFSKLGGKKSFDYMAILNSRSAMELVVQQFDLLHEYNIKNGSMENAVKELRSNVEYTLKDDGSILIDVFDKDSHRAANMANYFVDVLNQISVSLNGQHNKSNREFIGKRVEDTKSELRNAEDNLKSFQEKNSSIVIPTQAENAIKAIAELYANKAKYEVAIAVMERSMGNNSPELKQMRIELEELDKKLAQVPKIGLDYIRAYRDVVVQQKIFEYLVPLYEQARIEEQKDLPVVLVLDRAIAPEKAEKPSKRLLAFFGAFISLLVSFLMITFREYTAHLKSTYPQDWSNIAPYFSWFRRSKTS